MNAFTQCSGDTRLSTLVFEFQYLSLTIERGNFITPPMDESPEKRAECTTQNIQVDQV